jgi:hypothetical protein
MDKVLTKELMQEWVDAMSKKLPKNYGIYEVVLIGKKFYTKAEIMEMLNTGDLSKLRKRRR